MSGLGDIKDLAGMASVSPLTITRFVKRLGFERFADFHRAIRLEVQDREVSRLALLQRHREKPKLGRKGDAALFADMVASPGKLQSPTVRDALDKAAFLIADKNWHISILGGRWSSVGAQYLAFQLVSLCREVHAVLSMASGLAADRLADLGRKDVLVVYDFRRYQPDTLGFAAMAAKRKVRIVLSTDLGLSPICDVADVIIPVEVATTSPLGTLVPALAATNALLARLIAQVGDTAGKRMKMLEELRHAARGPSARERLGP